jgi:hypothetical protein
MYLREVLYTPLYSWIIGQRFNTLTNTVKPEKIKEVANPTFSWRKNADQKLLKKWSGSITRGLP